MAEMLGRVKQPADLAGFTAAELAQLCAEIRDFLLASGASLDLPEASALGNLARVRELVENKHADANSFSLDGFPVVALAAFLGHLEIVQYLAAHGADINAVQQGKTPLDWALAKAAGGALDEGLLGGAGIGPALPSIEEPPPQPPNALANANPSTVPTWRKGLGCLITPPCSFQSWGWPKAILILEKARNIANFVASRRQGQA